MLARLVQCKVLIWIIIFINDISRKQSFVQVDTIVCGDSGWRSSTSHLARLPTLWSWVGRWSPYIYDGLSSRFIDQSHSEGFSLHGYFGFLPSTNSTPIQYQQLWVWYFRMKYSIVQYYVFEQGGLRSATQSFCK